MSPRFPIGNFSAKYVSGYSMNSGNPLSKTALGIYFFQPMLRKKFLVHQVRGKDSRSDSVINIKIFVEANVSV